MKIVVSTEPEEDACHTEVERDKQPRLICSDLHFR